MSWAFGIDRYGREAGYGVACTCDCRGCEAVIHRGLAFICGDRVGGGERGCGRFFCSDHRRWRNGGFLCPMCARSSGAGEFRKHLGREIEEPSEEVACTTRT